MTPTSDNSTALEKAVPATSLATTQAASSVLTYRFADFRLSTRRQCLNHNGTEIPLSTKLYHLLLAFLEHPDRILTKNDITRAAWPGQIVTDAAIAKQVQRLRQLLEETGHEVPLIETHRGMGYRLTCTVKPDYGHSAGKPGRTKYARRWPRIAAAALLVAAGSAWLGLNSRSSDDAVNSVRNATLALQPVADDAPFLTEGASEHFASQLGSTAEITPAIALEGEPALATDLASLRLAESRAGPVAAIHLAMVDGAYALTVSVRDGKQKKRGEFSGQSVAALLERGTEWLRGQVGSLVVVASPAPPSDALTSYFAGLAAMGAGQGCESAMDHYRAAVGRDPGFHRARLRLAHCERVLGRPHEAAALAAVLVANARQAGADVALAAQLIAARAHHDLGNTAEARRQLEEVEPKSKANTRPLSRLLAMEALTLLARLDGDTERALALNRERLELAQAHYPLASYLADAHLALADGYLVTGQHDLLVSHAKNARSLAEEIGDRELLMESYRYLASSYFRNGDLDAAVQLALAARPIIDATQSVVSKAYFLQFSTMALNLRGLFEPAREYTEALRMLSGVSADPMYGAIADFTVMHRLYVQGAYADAHALASSTRSRLEVGHPAHAALPLALAFEAIAASRSAPVADASALVDLLDSRYHGDPALVAPVLRARGHIAVRSGRIQDGIALLRQAETVYRQSGMASVANYVAYELTELRLLSEPTAPWDDLERLSYLSDFDYPLARLQARALAAEGDYIGATTALEEARLRGNDLWSDEDQLLLEEYQSMLAMAEVSAPDV